MNSIALQQSDQRIALVVGGKMLSYNALTSELLTLILLYLKASWDAKKPVVFIAWCNDADRFTASMFLAGPEQVPEWTATFAGHQQQAEQEGFKLGVRMAARTMDGMPIGGGEMKGYFVTVVRLQSGVPAELCLPSTGVVLEDGRSVFV